MLSMLETVATPSADPLRVRWLMSMVNAVPGAANWTMMPLPLLLVSVPVCTLTVVSPFPTTVSLPKLSCR